MTENNVQDFAQDVQVESHVRPRWLTNLAYILVFWGLVYFIATANDGGLEGPNWVFWIILAVWLIYTPIAVKKKWFVIRL